jgi:phosphatidylserine/phosphatidylglycerophosphate/cardiolipin synthase-like enzyme
MPPLLRSLVPVDGLIAGAQRSVRITMYELSDPDAVAAVIAAAHRGVDTKVLLASAFHGRDVNSAAFNDGAGLVVYGFGRVDRVSSRWRTVRTAMRGRATRLGAR